MLVGAIVWAAITVASEHQIGWMALGVGALVGWAVSFGKGGKAFGLLGALLALIGCILGNFLSIVAFAVAREKIGVLTSLAGLDYAKVATLMWDSFLSTDFLFYAIAVYEGYRFSSVGRGK